MNYEKAYKEALERAKRLYKDAITLQLEQDIKDYETIFPELAESEDEKMMKCVKYAVDYLFESKKEKYICGTCKDKVIAWLKKQGEQKSILDELEMTLSVSEDAYLRSNIEKLIKKLKKEEQQ